MSRLFKKSIEAFISKLKKCIEFYSSSEFSSNVDSNRDSMDKLDELIKKYTDKELNELDEKDLANMSIIDIKAILKIVEDNKERNKEIISYIGENPTDKKAYKEVLEALTRYAESFNVMDAEQASYADSKINLYKKYIDLFSKPITEIFDDTEELISLMGSVNLEDEYQSSILKYIVEENAKLITNLPLNPSLMDKVDNTIAKYLPDESSEVYKTVYKYLKNEISTDPEEIAFKEELDLIDVQNTVMVFTLSTLREAYINSEDNQEKLELEAEIKETLLLEIQEEYKIIKEAEEYLNKYSSEYIACIKTGNDDFEHYVNTSITELELEYGSRETAYVLRKMFFIKLLDETLSTTFAVRDDEEKFMLGCDNLHELIQLLKDAEEKEQLEKENKQGGVLL